MDGHELKPAQPMPSAANVGAMTDATLVSGVLHVFLALDWGEEIDLERAKLLTSGKASVLPRRPRTPPSFAYRPPPLGVSLPTLAICLPGLGEVQATGEARIFDFGAVSVAFRLPFQLPAAEVTLLAKSLAEPDALVATVATRTDPLYEQLLPAIQHPLRSDLQEEYFVFQLAPQGPFADIPRLLASDSAWLASVLRMETSRLSPEEVAEALRLRLSYTARDLFLCEWALSVLIDDDCEETLQVIEFANVQLLEFRHIDDRLDDRLETAYRLIHPLTRTWLPFWRTYSRPVRALGEMRIEANQLFERTSNALKLVGDQYLARVYRLLGTRFHLDDWEKNIQQSLDVAQEAYQVVTDQGTTYRTELLEIIVILLILFEVVLGVLRI
jgi:hypothetical protein